MGPAFSHSTRPICHARAYIAVLLEQVPSGLDDESVGGYKPPCPCHSREHQGRAHV